MVEAETIVLSKNRGSDWTDWTDLGLDKHMIGGINKEEKPISEHEKAQIHLANKENTPISTPIYPIHPPAATHPTPSDSTSLYSCYHNECDFHTDDEQENQKHGTTKHLKNPLLFPTKFEIERSSLQAQGKDWEI